MVGSYCLKFPMRISVLLPARESVPLTITKAINNLKDRADEPESIEFIVCLDADDPLLLSSAEEVRRARGAYHTISGFSKGYRHLYVQWNECARHADSRWLMLWNCDAEMLTDGWDTYLDKFKDDICVVQPEDNHNALAFVIFPRLVYQLLGHVTRHPFMDWWINQLIERQGKWPAYREGFIRVQHSWTRNSPNAKASLDLQHDLHKVRKDFWLGEVQKDVDKLRKAYEDHIRP